MQFDFQPVEQFLHIFWLDILAGEVLSVNYTTDHFVIPTVSSVG